MSRKKTIVGRMTASTLDFTAGGDVTLDLALLEWDCIGTAAHVTMLSKMRAPSLFSSEECDAVVKALVDIMRRGREGKFSIRAEDQDIHLAVERELTRKLGDAGKRVHTGRSRNDQVAVDLRLYGKQHLLDLTDRMLSLCDGLLKLARRHRSVPMVGRTHMQPAMPSSVGLWASAYAEALLDDLIIVRAAAEYNDVCPLGAAAGYGVPLQIDRELTARLLGFSRPHLNVIHAVDSRGKCEGIILSACAQLMLTLSRLAQDIMLFSMPEFGYFRIPAGFSTGSSIMPQKNNPDIFELVRARAAVVQGYAQTVQSILRGLPSGYNRDAQETKAPFMAGVRCTQDCAAILGEVVPLITPDQSRLRQAFTGPVFATDRALELVADGMPFRDAYAKVKAGIEELEQRDPVEAIAAKTHLGTTGGLDFDAFNERARASRHIARRDMRRFHHAISRLLDTGYPDLS